ncbi:choline/ethanolaminephosphotransferase 1-like [Ostrea edulis]|uniref:choline/ethanolaminephosphotransferase 1-like n=1 Tax=Ostrea edulis TaxID=37623 RepID=UPI002095BA54|nr:choline/ethanolaminephosphotransferase 1-like [Ostrea edulis]
MKEVLTQTQLKNLKEHKYSATGQSLIEPWFQIYWRWLIEQVPVTWAPNSITLLGLVINIVTTLLLVVCSPDSVREAPGFVYLLCSLGLFIYQSLDAIDGKQARRTKTNTPLGELFDHGCDSISTVVVGLGVSVGLELGRNLYWMMFEFFMAIFLFYMAHWQAYVTGTLRFSQFDVTETQFMIIVLHFVNFLFGSHIWNFKLPLLGIPLRMAMVYFSLGPAFLQLYNNVGIILQGGTGKNKSTIAGTSTIFPAFPIGIVIALAVMIAHKSPSHLFENNPCLYLLSFGILSAKVINRLIVAHMTKSEMDLLDSGILGPLLLFLNQYFNCLINETFVLWICFFYVSQDILRYCMAVCQQICQFLGIYCFDIVTPYHGKKSGKQS